MSQEQPTKPKRKRIIVKPKPALSWSEALTIPKPKSKYK